MGLGLDSRLGLSVAQLRDLAPEASALGYQSLWTNAGVDYDPIAVCVAWHERSGLPTGVSVVPIARNPAPVLALAARTAHELTAGRFVLGVGSGSVTDRPIAAVRSYVDELRQTAKDVPIYVGALGPQMLALAGRHAEGAALNWCTPAQVTWSRERTGPRAKVIEYIRMCVDDDVAAARVALAKQILAYALQVRPPGARGYRSHFERMGFTSQLDQLEVRRASGASDDDLARAVPDEMLSAFGYAGPASGAAAAFKRLSAGLDVGIVRVLVARHGDIEGVRAAMRAVPA
ncbi:MAG TPA: LLM class flavin-dependent oxidoreductase [Candidatus Limnocylindria bacterium]|nr:LLM class flavin-dependent oxidoreductase [Candidatus Limnocylindria bacterium]